MRKAEVEDCCLALNRYLSMMVIKTEEKNRIEHGLDLA